MICRTFQLMKSFKFEIENHLYFRGRQTFKELLEFAEEISILTKRFLSPSHPIKRRIGALYTLYGLYNKFPLG